MKLLLSHASPPVTAQVFSSETWHHQVPVQACDSHTRLCSWNTLGTASCPDTALPAGAHATKPQMNRLFSSFHFPLCPWAYLHRTHGLIQIFSLFNLLLHGYCHDFELWYRRRMCLWCTDDKFYIWINVQEVVQRREKSDIMVFRLCFGVCTINSESYLQQDSKIFLAYEVQYC